LPKSVSNVMRRGSVVKKSKRDKKLDNLKIIIRRKTGLF
jgi:hypothetical protein